MRQEVCVGGSAAIGSNASDSMTVEIVIKHKVVNEIVPCVKQIPFSSLEPPTGTDQFTP